jgi:hypothetical protein
MMATTTSSSIMVNAGRRVRRCDCLGNACIFSLLS